MYNNPALPLALLLVAAGCSSSARPAASIAPATGDQAVVLISLDGFRADYLDRPVAPNLRALARDGVRAEWMTPSFPTKTVPNH
jgi:predicted AlkP superfamily pyrophosphatase or phosphodiesterase